MKRFLWIVVLALCISIPAFADSAEQVRVIKFDLSTKDLIVERSSGEKLLIQHNRVCNSMSTEFPVYLIWHDNKVIQLKVGFNEICDVYNSGTYTADATMVGRITPSNPLETEHLADLQWNNKVYRIDYGVGCKFLKEFIGKQVYLNTPRGTLTDATLYLPNDRGQCQIAEENVLGEVEVPVLTEGSPVYDIRYVAQNNEAQFYWKTKTPDATSNEPAEKWLYLISYSKFKLNPDDYHWRQMPNLRFSPTESFLSKQLANKQKYYFYIAARTSKGVVSPWQEVEVTPVQTAARITNQPDPTKFEISLSRASDHYDLSWPDVSADSRRYMIQVFVDGKRTLLKIIDGTIHTWRVDITPTTQDSEYRMLVQSMPKETFGARHADSIYWKGGEE